MSLLPIPDLWWSRKIAVEAGRGSGHSLSQAKATRTTVRFLPEQEEINVSRRLAV